jgi:tRNA(Ile)-lysidine synthase
VEFTGRLKQFCKEQKWGISHSATLLAVSGGIDSVVMAWLFHKLNFPFGIAHINFQLRNEDSDNDQLFLQELSKKLSVPFYSTSLATQQESRRLGASIQVTARNFRYQWLEEIRKGQNYKYIATAHHLDDSFETLLFNLSNGCGLRGLHGIPVQNEAVIRPLLWATRHEIEEYAKTENISYRLDHSNLEEKYSRNFIRHRIIPLFETLNPGLRISMQRTLSRIGEAEVLYDQALGTLKERWFREEKDLIYIERSELKKHPARTTILYEWLSPFGFSNTHIQQMLKENTTVGAEFLSVSHRVVVDRSTFILSPVKNEADEDLFFITEENTEVRLPGGRLVIQRMSERPKSFKTTAEQVYLNANRLSYPLQIRRWKAGDIFHPFGMKGKRQKVKDYFINNKLSRVEKERSWLLISEGQICWIIGQRADERYKINENSQDILSLRWESDDQTG